MVRLLAPLALAFSSTLIWAGFHISQHLDAVDADLEFICAAAAAAAVADRDNSSPALDALTGHFLRVHRTEIRRLDAGRDHRGRRSGQMGALIDKFGRDQLGGEARHGFFRGDVPVLADEGRGPRSLLFWLATPRRNSWAAERSGGGALLLATRYEGVLGAVVDWRVAVIIAAASGALFWLLWRRRRLLIVVALLSGALQLGLQWTAQPDAGLVQQWRAVDERALRDAATWSGDPEAWQARRCGRGRT